MELLFCSVVSFHVFERFLGHQSAKVHISYYLWHTTDSRVSVYKTEYVHSVVFRYSAVEREGPHGKYRAKSLYGSNVVLFLDKSIMKRHGVWKRETSSTSSIDMGIGTYAFRDTNVFFFFKSWSPKIRPIGCPGTSLRNDYYFLRSNPEERISRNRYLITHQITALQSQSLRSTRP